jgi:hypothetical protein
MVRKYSRGGEGVTPENESSNGINKQCRNKSERKVSGKYTEMHKVKVVALSLFKQLELTAKSRQKQYIET